MRRVLLAVSVATLLAGADAPAAHAATLNLSASASTLFALNADRGTFTPTAKKGTYVLTLSRLDRRGVWFTDRPARKAGSITPRALVSAWSSLGFASSPPNAVVTLPGGRKSADTVAIALSQPRYSTRTGTVRFTARVLAGLNSALSRYQRRVDAKLPRRFGDAALFIDNGLGYGCTTGDIGLVATRQTVSGVIPANGQSLSIASNSALFAIYGGVFTEGPIAATFRVPKLTAPAGMTYGICATGYFPSQFANTPCNAGELRLTTFWPHSRNWTARRDIPAPLPYGLQWLQCQETVSDGSPCTMGTVTLFSGTSVPADYLATSGQQLLIRDYNTLYIVMDETFVGPGSAPTSFTLPSLAGPAPDTTYGICATGSLPGNL